MSRFLQALKQLEARPDEAAPAPVVAPLPVPSPVAETPIAETPPVERPVTERIEPRRKRRKVRRTRPLDFAETSTAALETAAEIERLLGELCPQVIECWTTPIIESQAVVTPAAELSPDTPIAPQVVLQECLPPVPALAEAAPVEPPLEPTGETEIELTFHREKPRRSPAEAKAKAKRRRATERPAPDARELQVRTIVRGPQPQGVTRPSAWETTIRADVEDAQLAAPLQRLVERWRSERGTATTSSLLIAGVANPLLAAEVTMRAAVLLSQQDDASALVIDADPEGVLSRRLAIIGKTGLSELIAPQDAHGESIYPTATARVHVLPRGRGPWPATATSAATAKLLADLGHDYVWLLISAGDALAAPVQAFARSCAGTYVVVPLGQTDLTVAQQQLAALHSAGARVLGAVAVGGE
jgi:Mrp family chromosome partitioning ATPase